MYREIAAIAFSRVKSYGNDMTLDLMSIFLCLRSPALTDAGAEREAGKQQLDVAALQPGTR